MFDQVATVTDAVREWAWVVGQERPNQQWLLSDYDSWEVNPHYTGPAQRHPEDYDGAEDLPRPPAVTDEMLREALEQYMGGMLVLSEIIQQVCAYDYERDRRVS